MTPSHLDKMQEITRLKRKRLFECKAKFQQAQEI